MLLGGLNFNNRFESFFNIGLQLGGFVVGRVRILGRVVIFPADPDDQYRDDNDIFVSGGGQNEFFPVDSEPPAVLYGGSAGLVLASTANFVLAPGAVFMRSDVNDYGNFLGVSLPFDWVTDRGLRVGFEVSVGRTFGGEYLARCQGGFTGGPPAPSTICDPGEERLFDRDAAAGFYSHFQIGWGFNRPEPTRAP